MSWKEFIQDDRNGGHGVYFEQFIETNPITEDDLKYCEAIINTARNGGNIEYDMFPDDGGIVIAALLLAEVKRLRAIIQP